MKPGDRVRLKGKQKKPILGTLGRTDRHEIEWFVKWDDPEHGTKLMHRSAFELVDLVIEE